MLGISYKLRQMKFLLVIIPTTNYDSLEEYVVDSKDKGLTHIIVDDNKNRQMFLKDVFANGENFPYLKKVYDSKSDGFNYHVKVFEINYKSLNNVN